MLLVLLAVCRQEGRGAACCLLNVQIVGAAVLAPCPALHEELEFCRDGWRGASDARI